MIEAQAMSPEDEKRARKRAYQAEYRAVNRDLIRAQKAEYYAENREKVLEAQAEYYAENRDKRLAAQAGYYARNRDKRNAYGAGYNAKNKKALLVKNAAKRAKASGMEFSIAADDLTWPDVCPVLGIPLNYDGGKGSNQPDSPSLDRWNNSAGYTKHNTVVISWRANCLKRDGTLDEMIRVGYYMKYGKVLPPAGAEDLWGPL